MTMAPLLALLLAAESSLPFAPRPSRIDETRHNFYGPGSRSHTAGMDLCQFCHVPNRLELSDRPAPRWDRATGDRPRALSAKADPNGPPLALRWAGSTLRCLACHDGTVSSISIVFRPNSTSLRYDEVAGDRLRRDAIGNSFALPDQWAGKVMGNHPVAIPYPLELDPSLYRGFEPRAAPVNAREWNRDPRGSGLKLFNDQSGFDALRGSAGIECASCHDPHGTGNTFFLRVIKSGSQLCLSCHQK